MSDLRDRAMDATLAEVDNVGLRALTVEAVATTSGISRATLYRHFPGGRDELIATTIDREVSRFFDAVVEAAGEVDDVIAHLTRLVVAAHRTLDSHALLQRLLADEADAILPSLATLQPMLLDAVADHLQHLLSLAAAQGLLVTDLDRTEAGRHLARMILSYIGTGGRWDLADAEEARALVAERLVVGIVAR